MPQTAENVLYSWLMFKDFKCNTAMVVTEKDKFLLTSLTQGFLFDFLLNTCFAQTTVKAVALRDKGTFEN